MSFDFAKTFKLIQGGLLDHTATWTRYLEENNSWKDTALVLTGPLLIANIFLGQVFSRLFGGFAYYGYYGNFFVALVMALIMGAIGFMVAVLVINFLAGTFQGKPDFNRAFAAASLAAIPSWVAGVVASLIPSLGFVIALAGGIVSLVFLYKILPMALDLPDEKRMTHFIASIVLIVVINGIVGYTMGRGSMTGPTTRYDVGDVGSPTSGTSSPGMMGELERQSRLWDAAEADVYEPPADGKLDEEQVETYISVMKKTRALQERHTEKMEKMAEEMKAREDAGETPSITDMGRMYSGIGSAVAANNAEMEVVKTGEGNWAEHQWVKQQLRVAMVQQGEGSEALEHNYALYEKYADELEL